MGMLEMQPDALSVVEKRSEIMFGVGLRPAHCGDGPSNLSGQIADMVGIKPILLSHPAARMNCPNVQRSGEP